MVRQANLFDQFGETLATQRDMFAGNDYSTSRKCEHCGSHCVRTESGYDVCERGCTGLIPNTQEGTTMSVFFSSNRPEDKSGISGLHESILFARDNEASDAVPDREYSTFAGWKRAIKASCQNARIEGDRDIANAFNGTKSIGEWDGSSGYVSK